MSRPRGRPRDEQLAAERREALVEAAYAVFAEKGYLAASIADIDERLDVGRGTFYRYFQSKREILDHAVDHGVERFLGAIPEAAAPGSAGSLDELVGQLGVVGEHVFALAEHEPGLVRLMLLEATSIDDAMTNRLLGMMDIFGGVVGAYLDHGVRSGFVRRDIDASALGATISFILVPVLVRAAQGRLDAAERERFTAALTDLLRAGLHP